MGMRVSDSGSGDFKHPDDGTYPARCYRILDLGMQEQSWEGKKSLKHQLIMGFELCGTHVDDDPKEDPYVTSGFWTASLHERARLRQDLERWRGKAFTPDELDGFDLDAVLGKPCMLSLVTNENGRQKIDGIMALPKGVEVPELVNAPVSFTWEKPDALVFDNLPEGIQRIMLRSPEGKAWMAEREGNAGPVDDDPPPHTDADEIPF